MSPERQVLPENRELAKKISTLVDGVDPDAEPSESPAPAPQSNLAPEFVDERGSATSGGKVHPNAQSLGEMESGPKSADEGGFSEEYTRVISGDMTHEEYTEWYESTRRDGRASPPDATCPPTRVLPSGGEQVRAGGGR
ncbi:MULTISPECIES: hypothetical protein [Dermacoccus]|uniref:Uncharacterized protein n=2 Tax=Dermacoccus TaxID=57495 RepID=A0A417Z306_9MICO|nr:hypothetical protein [Dermacoccus abyssi]RHW44560.1 hypothetical protein D1832_11845 [Dermacoccus abyssi]